MSECMVCGRPFQLFAHLTRFRVHCYECFPPVDSGRRPSGCPLRVVPVHRNKGVDVCRGHVWWVCVPWPMTSVPRCWWCAQRLPPPAQKGARRHAGVCVDRYQCYKRSAECGWRVVDSDRAIGACRECGGVLPKSHSKYCSKLCNLRAQGVYKPCRDCGGERPEGSHSSWCPECLVGRRRDWNRRKNSKRRGVMTGSYKLADIAARDGFRCHLCGKKVNMKLSGTHRRAPTIDHLVPVSADGVDEAHNVALAHFGCNSRRGHLGEAQLLLFG